MTTQPMHWNDHVRQQAVERLGDPGGMVVAPTKVGYIVMTTDRRGLERKFDAKQRPLSKPGVVLVSSLEMLHELAETNPEIDALYQRCWDEDVLLGCILPWRASGERRIPADGSRELVMDARSTSCFVIRFGVPAEAIARDLWERHGLLSFASSANPSGQGNRGVLAGIGERISAAADLLVEADDYVASIQPDRDADTRWEQGVMVSMVDQDGHLVPEQHGARSVTPAPSLIRKGLDLDRIMRFLSDRFPSWDHRHGQYH
ncbi:L-threonylcarbamoyladenylate synthase [Curtobacterium sp. VKM Ac-2922]|uniref:L-threonylcarbamoyladenylate synthase n=1 Tax=Curtobacterium sp. VKM Ac-2922 TaxID=2929475 RepID=UPI001FB52974|nr:Sua5/YciO/YrdC/YwlC family protein [Curtobacterium sp. VKM Ac-2922]MCJ1714758.1 Sua5/YciO/YrdC/YwlC family protein [Curtobacterium sp. VKM Ac-2922]